MTMPSTGETMEQLLEVRLRKLQRALVRFHCGRGLVHGGHRLVEARLRRAVLGAQILRPFQLDLRQRQRRLGICQRSLGLGDGRLENRGIDLGDHLPGFHLRIPVGIELLDVAGNLAAYLHVDHRD